jgi:hypothetical protein
MNEPVRDQEMPSWFSEPCPPGKARNDCLFKVSLQSVLPRLQVSFDELQRWHHAEWLSFDPAAPIEVDQFDDETVWEVIFVRDITRAGLSDAQIAWFLKQCPKPFGYHPDRISFSFRHGWVEAVPPPSPEKVIDDQLSSWVEEGDVDSLKSLRHQIDRHLDSLGDREDDTSV